MSVEQTSGCARSLLRVLNVFGLSHLDTVILAALADERPLLLIGPPGTAKSELLNRIAASLSLEHRHYNASLISFDDLLGYPVPNRVAALVQPLRPAGPRPQASRRNTASVSHPRHRPADGSPGFARGMGLRVARLPPL